MTPCRDQRACACFIRSRVAGRCDCRSHGPDSGQIVSDPGSQLRAGGSEWALPLRTRRLLTQPLSHTLCVWTCTYITAAEHGWAIRDSRSWARAQGRRSNLDCAYAPPVDQRDTLQRSKGRGRMHGEDGPWTVRVMAMGQPSRGQRPVIARHRGKQGLNPVDPVDPSRRDLVMPARSVTSGRKTPTAPLDLSFAGT